MTKCGVIFAEWCKLNRKVLFYDLLIFIVLQSFFILYTLCKFGGSALIYVSYFGSSILFLYCICICSIRQFKTIEYEIEYDISSSGISDSTI
jgi:hypothetical protein